MKDSVFKTKLFFTILALIITLLIFTPLYYSISRIFLNSADELVNSWYQSEKISIQQGNILSSLSKLQRSIDNSTILKGIVVNDKNGHSLLRIGRVFEIDQNIIVFPHKIHFKKTGFSDYTYYFSESGIFVYILVSSNLPYLAGASFFLYIIIIFLIFGYLIRKESIALEKIKNERALDSIKMKMELDKKLLLLSQQVAHDIRSPLAALNIISSQISSSLEDSNEMKQILNFSIERINDISNDLLKQHKVKNLELEIISINKLVKKVIAEKNILLADKEMSPITFIPSDINISAEVSSIELSRVLSNLINNSIDAISKENGLIKITTSIKDNDLMIAISDNGKGIPTAVLSKIGNYGYSFDKNIGIENGNGLGLYHAKKTLEYLKGSLYIQSELNKGTDVTLKLPCFIIESQNTPSRQLILFEDDQLVRLSWEFKARKLGIDLIIFLNFEEFNKLHASKSFPLSVPIYSDINLSANESGLEVVKKLNNLGFNNIHLCTGYDRSDLKVPSFIKSVIDKNFPLS